jgi:hypothetical protein
MNDSLKNYKTFSVLKTTIQWIFVNMNSRCSLISMQTRNFEVFLHHFVIVTAHLNYRSLFSELKYSVQNRFPASTIHFTDRWQCLIIQLKGREIINWLEISYINSVEKWKIQHFIHFCTTFIMLVMPWKLFPVVKRKDRSSAIGLFFPPFPHSSALI